MKALLLLALITVSEATIGVFVKLSDGLIPVQTLTFDKLAITYRAAVTLCSILAWVRLLGDTP